MGGMTACGGVSRYVLFLYLFSSISMYWSFEKANDLKAQKILTLNKKHNLIDYLRDILVLPQETFLLFLLWILYIKLCQSFPSPNLVYSIMPPAHIEAENKQKGQKFWCVKTEVCRQACFINEIITLTKSTAISNSIFNKKMTNSQLQHILTFLLLGIPPVVIT